MSRFQENLDEQFLKETATKVANVLHMPLGEIEPLKLIELFSCLYILMGGDEELMIHWLNTHNNHLGFNPAARLTDEQSMNKIIGYLESMCYH